MVADGRSGPEGDNAFGRNAALADIVASQTFSISCSNVIKAVGDRQWDGKHLGNGVKT